MQVCLSHSFSPPLLSPAPCLLEEYRASHPAEYFEVLGDGGAAKCKEPGCLNYHMEGHLSNTQMLLSEQNINCCVKTSQSRVSLLYQLNYPD